MWPEWRQNLSNCGNFGLSKISVCRIAAKRREFSRKRQRSHKVVQRLSGASVIFFAIGEIFVFHARHFADCEGKNPCR